MRSRRIKASLVPFSLFMPLAISSAPFVEGSLDAAMGNEDSPIIFLCGDGFGEVMTALEFDRLVVEDVITIGYLALPSAVTSAGVKTHGEA